MGEWCERRGIRRRQPPADDDERADRPGGAVGDRRAEERREVFRRAVASGRDLREVDRELFDPRHVTAVDGIGQRCAVDVDHAHEVPSWTRRAAIEAHAQTASRTRVGAGARVASTCQRAEARSSAMTAAGVVSCSS
jgi:hypothetical protein